MRPESLSMLPVTGSGQLIVVTPFAFSTRDACALADATGGALTAAASARRIGAAVAAFPADWRVGDCSAAPVTTAD